ncbi:MAG: single-stranded-DNA-specific exonuclease RecJ [Clostridiales Family XIII bacterium]|jgi:single-stranded-DNA-specific exonuclease|nr:single-stranded-DNA-specific exonuclease RecJ [Clostridiales Family XIII bacterium]
MTRLHPAVARILNRRGVTVPADIEEFLSEKPKKTYDPFLLRNMREGVDFVLSAANANKRIYVYGDYDVDGIAAAALLVRALRCITDKVDWYIPSRFSEGYGLNKEALRNIADAGGHAVITVDCGSVSAEEVLFGQSLGLEILVTDHHNIEGRAAGCLIINPKQEGERYPFKGLAGCGVAFKLAQALQRELGLPKAMLNDALDLVGLATIADIVPLVDENRTLAKYGLNALRHTRRPGLRRLLEKLDLADKAIRAEQVAFIVAPHINAAGRRGEAKDVVELLLTDDVGVIERVTDELLAHNAERKRVQEEVFTECDDVAARVFGDGAPIGVINAGDAHEGITGIVAGKLKDKHNRPVIILTNSEGASEGVYLKGTGRSIPGVDMYKLLRKRGDMFEKFGGHAMACGFLMEAAHENRFRAELEGDMKALLARAPELLTQAAPSPDAEIGPGDISAAFIGQLNALEPFGNGNPAPLLAMRDRTVSDLTRMGDRGQVLKFNAGGVQCVLFSRADARYDALASGRPVSLFGYPVLENYKGRERIQFKVEHVTQFSVTGGCLGCSS